MKSYLYHWIGMFFVFLADLKISTAVIRGKSGERLGWKQDSPPLLAPCDVWQADHILCADSSTFSLTVEIASILLQGNNNLQIKMPKCCTCILLVIGRLAYST